MDGFTKISVHWITFQQSQDLFFRCDSISTFDHVSQSGSLYQNITKKTFITYMATISITYFQQPLELNRNYLYLYLLETIINS